MQKTVDKKAIATLSLGHFVVDLYASCLIPLYPFIVQKLGINLATISVIIGLGHLVSSMMQPLFGFMADKTRHRFYMFWGLVLSSIFIPMAVCANSVWHLALFLVLGVGGNALFHPQVITLVSTFNYGCEKLSKYMGLFMGLGTIGYAIGPVCASSLVAGFGVGSMYYLILLGILTAIAMYFIVPKIPLRSLKKTKESFLQLMKEILKSKKMLNLTFIAIVKSVVGISFGTYMPFLLAQHGYSLGAIGIIVTLFFTFAGIATIYSSKIERRIGAKNVIRLSFMALLPLTALFLWMFNINKILALIIFVITGFFVFLSVSVTIILAQKFMPHHRGVVSGVTTGFSWGLAAIMLAPLGFIAQKMGVELILLLVSGLAFLAGIFAVHDYLND